MSEWVPVLVSLQTVVSQNTVHFFYKAGCICRVASSGCFFFLVGNKKPGKTGLSFVRCYDFSAWGREFSVMVPTLSDD